ncbi:IS982 family transposase [Moorena producens]|uniref:IS982 family transposase n=1 Tax=Moorena producens TaxID=1155739 RepID=UPI0011EA6336|nr:IS982 family transposase [Moorena producens]
MDIETLFWELDDFCKVFELGVKSQFISDKITQKKRKRKNRLALSEVMTILIYFHGSNYRCFKRYYINHIANYNSSHFPNLVSYNRFIELIPQTLMPLLCYLNSRKGKNTGISFIDSTPIPICHPKRAKRNKVFKGLSAWGKNSIGWYYGFKLHLIINDQGELLAFQLTPANVDDRVPVPSLAQNLEGRLFGDKGYISKKLFKELSLHSLKLITPFKKNMKNQLVELWEKFMLRKRSLIETVNDQLKTIYQVSHSRHRSVSNFMVNMIAGLVAYTFQNKKPSLKVEKTEQENLPALVG